MTGAAWIKKVKEWRLRRHSFTPTPQNMGRHREEPTEGRRRGDPLMLCSAFIIPLINDGAIQSATIDRHFLTAGAIPMAFVTAHTFHKQLHW